ncbi:MAG TPA: S8 family serine peptidase [Sedimentisphaerales bacterium]|nr:S8 family serine peptidase [Sedimentisphaerales bacterium]
MYNLLKEYKKAVKISYLNQVSFLKSRGGKHARVAILDGPLDASRAALCCEYNEAIISNTSPCQNTSRKQESLALVHCCAIFDRLRNREKKANISVIRIFEQDLRTSPVTLFNAIVATVKAGVDVINVSVGINDFSEEMLANMKAACDFAVEHGAIIVAATKRKQQLIPAIFDSVIAVQGENLGKPGVFFVSTNPSFYVVAHGGVEMIRVNKKLHLLEGSSFATAEVSGIIAHLVTTYGRISLTECRKLLMQRANGIW